MQSILKLSALKHGTLKTDPYAWAEISNLYSAQDAAALAATYPHDHFKPSTADQQMPTQQAQPDKKYSFEQRGADTLAQPLPEQHAEDRGEQHQQ